MEQKKVTLLTIFMVFLSKAKSSVIQLKNPYPAFDLKLYKSVLDPEKCRLQLNYMRKNVLPTILFADASGRIPKGILEGNLVDLGSYHQCLSIDYRADDMDIEGKYCAVPFDAVDIIINSFENNSDVNMKKNKLGMRMFFIEQIIYARNINMFLERIHLIQKHRKAIISQMYNQKNITRQGVASLLRGFYFVADIGMCVPKSCTTQQVLNSSLFNVSRLASFKEHYCRLPNDKPWSPADTVAAVVFSVIGILTVICTAYDVTYNFLLKSEPDYRYLLWWSAYTNGRRLVTVASGSNTLNCLDGFRVLATLWVILGHTVLYHYNFYNSTDMLTWIRSMKSWYIISAPITVDTFFTMSGLLLVYNTCQKMSSRQFVLNLPLFYVRRLLRLFPLLGTAVLLQASFLHRAADGPLWHTVAKQTETCRTTWWITLLHLQNLFENPTCLGHSWYIAIDVHLYIISPIVIFWVLGGSKKSAWIALSVGLLAALTVSTIFIFNKNFFFNTIPSFRNIISIRYYMREYYRNVLTRAPPFFVGMMVGYLLYSYRGKRAHCSWHLVVACWCSAVVALVAIVLSSYYTPEDDWDHQLIDNLMNSYMRPAWATAIGWVIFACVHGYGGPVSWLLSLDMWRVPARLCYGAYLFHHPLIMVFVASDTNVEYFSPGRLTFMFMGYASVSFLISYFMTVLIDAPLSNICNRVLEKQKTNDHKQIITRM